MIKITKDSKTVYTHESYLDGHAVGLLATRTRRIQGEKWADRQTIAMDEHVCAVLSRSSAK